MATARDIATLWVKLTATFGPRFTDSYGCRDPGVWHDTLSRFSSADLTAGFRRMLSHHGIRTATFSGRDPVSIWPPNALEFRHYCEQARQHNGFPEPWQAFLEAKTNSYLSHPKWSHELIRTARDSVYRERRKRADDFLHDEDYSSFARYYVALRDAWLSFPEKATVSAKSIPKTPEPHRVNPQSSTSLMSMPLGTRRHVSTSKCTGETLKTTSNGSFISHKRRESYASD